MTSDTFKTAHTRNPVVVLTVVLIATCAVSAALSCLAFHLVRLGRKAEAESILFSDRYESERRIRAEGTDAIVNGLTAAASGDRRRHDRLAAVETAAFVLLVAVWITGWALVLRTVRQWRTLLVAHGEEQTKSSQLLEQQVAARTHELKERVKELTCLCSITRILHAFDRPLGEMLREAVAVIPDALQHPENAAARIELDGERVETGDYETSVYRLSVPVLTQGQAVGTVEVGYREQVPGMVEGSFIKEERALINAIAEQLAAVIDRGQTRQRYQILFDSCQDAIMTLEPPSWKFTASNPTARRMFGAENEAGFVSLGPWDLSPEFQPDGRPSAEKAEEMIETAMREGSHSFEWRHERLDGQEFSTTVFLTRVALGDRTILQATVRDVSDQKEVETRLRMLHRAVEQSSSTIVITDRAGNIEYANPRYEAITGYSRRE